MAWGTAPVQSQVGSLTLEGSQTVTLPATPTNGHLLVLYLRYWNSTSTAPTSFGVSDSVNGAWTAAFPIYNPTTNYAVQAFVCKNAGAPTQIMITESGGLGGGVPTWYYAYEEWNPNGTLPATLVDQAANDTNSAGASSTSSSGKQPSVTPTMSGELVLSMLITGNTITAPSVTDGLTVGESSPTSSAGLVIAYLTQGASGTAYNPSFSWTTSRTYHQSTFSLFPPSVQLTASLSFSGSLAKRLTRALTAALSFAGSFAKQLARSLSGVLSSAGGLARSAARALAASLTGSGTLSRQTDRSFSATLPSSGSVSRETERSLAGTLLFSGALQRLVSKGLSAVLSFVGSVTGRVPAPPLPGLPGLVSPSSRGGRVSPSYLSGLVHPESQGGDA